LDDTEARERQPGIRDWTFRQGRRAVPGAHGRDRGLDGRHEVAPLPQHLVLFEQFVLFSLAERVPVLLAPVGQAEVFHRVSSIVIESPRIYPRWVTFCRRPREVPADSFRMVPSSCPKREGRLDHGY